MRRALLPLQSVLLAILASWPALPRLGTEVLGHPDADAVKHVWTLWWTRREYFDGTPGARTRWINFPDGVDLHPIEPLDGLLALLLPLDPMVLANGLALANLVLLGLCAGWLGGLVSGRTEGALAAGALAQGSGFAAFTLHLGAGELRELWWLPLGLGCLVRARDTAAPRWFAALGLTLVGAMVGCFYHGFFLALSVALVALLTLRRALLLPYAVTALAAAVAVVPLVHAFAATWPAAREAIPGIAPVEWFVAPGGSPYAGGRFLGVGVVALAVAGLADARGRPWALLALAGALLSLGGEAFGALDRVLERVAAPMNFPARFAAVTTIALAALASLAPRWCLALVPVALVEVAWRGDVPWPRTTFPLPGVTGLTAPPGALADFTQVLQLAERRHGERAEDVLHHVNPSSRSRAIAAQMLLRRPLQITPLDRADTWATSGADWVWALPLVRSMLGEAVGAEDMRASVWLLHDRGFGAVLATHPWEGFVTGGPTAVLDEWLGARVTAGHASTWAVPERWVSEKDKEAWRREQLERVGR